MPVTIHFDHNIFFDETPCLPEENVSYFFNTCYREMSNFIYETPVTMVGLVVAGVAAYFFVPMLTLPLFALAGASLTSKLAAKIINRYDDTTFADIECAIMGFHLSVGKWHIVAGLVVIAVGYCIPYFGVVVCLGFGLYNGFVIEFEHCKAMQQARRRKEESGADNTLSDLLV